MKKLTIFLTTLSIVILTFINAIGQTISCNIWNTKDYSKFPDNINIPNVYSCDHCTWNFAKIEKLNKKCSYTAIHLTFSGLTDTCFFLTSNFKNISIKNKENKTYQHPYAILWESAREDSSHVKLIIEKKYMTNNFRVNNYKVNIIPKKKYDLIFLFNSANIGDSLLVDKFIKTIISK